MATTVPGPYSPPNAPQSPKGLHLFARSPPSSTSGSLEGPQLPNTLEQLPRLIEHLLDCPLARLVVSAPQTLWQHRVILGGICVSYHPSSSLCGSRLQDGISNQEGTCKAKTPACHSPRP